MLRAAGAPVFLFLNKTDRAGADPGRVYAELRARFSPDITDMDAGFTPEVLTALAERDDEFLEAYLGGDPDEAAALAAARRLVGAGRLFPCLRGAALRGEGVDRLLRALDGLTETHYDAAAPFGGTVYRVAHDGKGSRVAFFKVLSGAVQARDSVGGEKIQELRLYQGGRYEQVQRAEAGMLCGAVAPEQKPSNGLAIASLVLGILSIIMVFVYAWVGIICAIVGIVLAVVAKKQNPSGLATAGLVLSIIALAICIISIIAVIACAGALLGTLGSM